MPQVLTLPEPATQSKGSFTLSGKSYSLVHDTTLLGTPWVDQMNIARSIDYAGNAFAGMQLPATTMVDVSRKKTIVETAVAGRNGTIKELISAQDYMLRFRGLLINEKSLDQPHELINEMKGMFEFKGTLNVEGRLFRSLGIDAIVISDWNIKQIVGTPNAVAYDFAAVSDNSEEFVIVQGL